jgi:hypothetical protein
MGIQGMAKCAKCGTWCDRRNGSCGNAPKPAPAADPQQSASSAQGSGEIESLRQKAEAAELSTRSPGNPKSYQYIAGYLTGHATGMRIGAERERDSQRTLCAFCEANPSLDAQLTQLRAELEEAKQKWNHEAYEHEVAKVDRNTAEIERDTLRSDLALAREALEKIAELRNKCPDFVAARDCLARLTAKEGKE